jgi:arginyl-tRNA synthetase
MTLPEILTPSIEKAIKALFDVAIDKVEFQTTGKNLREISQWLSSFIKSNQK